MKTKIFGLLFCLMTVATMANNINVSNVSLSGQNTSTHTLNMNFSVGWDNSWRTTTNESNFDGAWLCFKYRVNNTGAWLHCSLTPNTGLSGTGAGMVIPLDKKGAFIFRSALNTGIGSVNFNGNMLVWEYGTDGVADNATVEVRAFALEMVYIPTGSYWLGGTGTEANAFKLGNTSGAYNVTSAAAISVNNSTGLNFNGVGTGTSIPDNFPNGYNDFWVMKYECSQQQYADFLNTLTALQANNLNTTPTNNITGTYPNFTPVYADRVYTDFEKNTAAKKLTSFAEWMGLRPMSEMEFEKTCRGVGIPPVANEFAWGTDVITFLTAVTNAGQPNESVSTPASANAFIPEFSGSLGARVGLFARTSGSTREKSGAGYYGVMNLSDNVFEIVIAAGTDDGRAITRQMHGTGSLNTNGFTDRPEWQLIDAFMRRGASYRLGGGNITLATENARVATRNQVVTAGVPAGDGIRLARTAP